MSGWYYYWQLYQYMLAVIKEAFDQIQPVKFLILKKYLLFSDTINYNFSPYFICKIA